MNDRISLRVAPDAKEALDRFRGDQRAPLPSRQDALRHIISDWLSSSGYLPLQSSTPRAASGRWARFLKIVNMHKSLATLLGGFASLMAVIVGAIALSQSSQFRQDDLARYEQLAVREAELREFAIRPNLDLLESGFPPALGLRNSGFGPAVVRRVLLGVGDQTWSLEEGEELSDVQKSTILSRGTGWPLGEPNPVLATNVPYSGMTISPGESYSIFRVSNWDELLSAYTKTEERDRIFDWSNNLYNGTIFAIELEYCSYSGQTCLEAGGIGDVIRITEAEDLVVQ